MNPITGEIDGKWKQWHQELTIVIKQLCSVLSFLQTIEDPVETRLPSGFGGTSKQVYSAVIYTAEQ